MGKIVCRGEGQCCTKSMWILNKIARLRARLCETDNIAHIATCITSQREICSARPPQLSGATSNTMENRMHALTKWKCFETAPIKQISGNSIVNNCAEQSWLLPLTLMSFAQFSLSVGKFDNVAIFILVSTQYRLVCFFVCVCVLLVNDQVPPILIRIQFHFSIVRSIVFSNQIGGGEVGVSTLAKNINDNWWWWW